MFEFSVGESIEIIGDYIEKSCQSYYSLRKKNHRLELKRNNEVAFLRKGTVSAYREDNNKVTLTIEAPAILGMAQMLHNDCLHYFRCDQDSELFTFNKGTFINLLSEQKLWHHAFIILSHHLELYFQREKILSQKDVSSMVKAHLEYLWKKDPVSRAKTSVYTFILARNQVSRSSLHKVMAQLTSQGLIKLINGKLVWISEDINKN
ncbi:helix-turn-helix domain-containing protein [Citrobacter portucalensis]|uniref:helix-turn-helix domain-containing protein n=1 Tax=Citrobacter portucalensis TaxID=1639133 RepID=UPI00226B29C3|nr:helix-turn-helix domain-containing protein [Citrobacter portucalensis]MCX8986144.1 helix-turn-helix domain-containing protein [Citrobacter portucalensis]